MFEIAAGRKALVTGGASGFGFAVAERLDAAGAGVAIADSEADAVDAAAARLRRRGADRHGRRRPGRGGRRVRRRRFDALGGLDTLVNSAGVFEFRPFEEIPEAEWDWILGVNLKGVFLTCQAAMPHLRASGRGRVVNIASDAGKKGYALISTYVASKFGVVGLTQSLAAEFGPFGVTVNAVCPSTVAGTGMGQKVLEREGPPVRQAGRPGARGGGGVVSAAAAGDGRRRRRHDHVPGLGERRLDQRRVDQHRWREPVGLNVAASIRNDGKESGWRETRVAGSRSCW